MGDILLYIIIGAFILLILYSIFRNNQTMRQQPQPDYRQRGDEVPEHDDPNIRGSGNFGRPAEDRNADFEWMEAKQNKTVNVPPKPPSDSPNIKGHGSFGRDQK